MIRFLVGFGLGVFVSRALRPRPAAAREQPAAGNEIRTASLSGFDDGTISASSRVVEAETWENKPEDPAVIRARQVVAVGDRSSAAVGQAHKKARDSSLRRPKDLDLAAKATGLLNVQEALGQAFWLLYARDVAQAAIDDLDQSTTELEATAREMPSATATVSDINTVGTAATKVGTAAKKALSTSKPAAKTG